MNYESIILEMLSRIQTLEHQVGEMENMIGQVYDGSTGRGAPAGASAQKVTTAEIRGYIEQMKRTAAEAGEESVTIRAYDVHKAMGLKSRFPMVCNAMRQCMTEDDKVTHDTPSGYSSTLEIKYYLS